MEFTIVLDDEKLLCLTETLALNYASGALAKQFGEGNVSNEIVLGGITKNLGELLRSLLRDPLKNKAFRKKFNTFFEGHEVDMISEIAWPWMEELLVWES